MTTGGYIGGRPDGLLDVVPVVLAPGEVWLDRRQIDIIEQTNPAALDHLKVNVIDDEGAAA